MFLKPVLVLLVNKLQVFEWDFVLFGSLAHLGPLVAFLGSASQVDHFHFVHVGHGLEIVIQGLEDIVFGLVHVPKVFHELRKHIFVSENAPF